MTPAQMRTLMAAAGPYGGSALSMPDAAELARQARDAAEDQRAVEEGAPYQNRRGRCGHLPG